MYGNLYCDADTTYRQLHCWPVGGVYRGRQYGHYCIDKRCVHRGQEALLLATNPHFYQCDTFLTLMDVHLVQFSSNFTLKT